MMRNYSKITEEECSSVQKNLVLLLACFHMSMDDLACQIGMTRQAISLYTTCERRMPKTSCISILAIFDYIIEDSQNEILKVILESIINEDYDTLLANIEVKTLNKNASNRLLQIMTGAA